MQILQRKLVLTDDGSHTIAIPDLNITSHSRHGAIQESKHVFIEAGLRYVLGMFPDAPINILEVGFGTGLNAFLTAIEAERLPLRIRYNALDAYPLDMVMTTALNYPDRLGHEELFNKLQLAPWNVASHVHESFTLLKEDGDLLGFSSREPYDLIFFDAFAPDVQPELWTSEVFARLGALTRPGGALVTYCSKSAVRHALTGAGWKVEKLPGPKGKREMVRAIRT